MGNGGTGVVAGFVSVASLVVVASIIYQVGKSKNTDPALATIVSGAERITGTLYKG